MVGLRDRASAAGAKGAGVRGANGILPYSASPASSNLGIAVVEISFESIKDGAAP